MGALLEIDFPLTVCNAIIEMAFLLLFRDLINSFVYYTDGVINLLG